MAIFGKSDPLPALLKRLRSPGPFVAGELAELCDRVFADPDLDLVSNVWLLTHGKRPVREAAMSCVAASTQQHRVIEKVLKTLSRVEPEIRRDLAKMIARVAPDKIMAQLPALVHHKNQARRETALDLIMASASLSGFFGYLKALLKDEVVAIRMRCVRVLSRETENPTVCMILRSLIDEENDLVRASVIEALAKRPDPDMIEPFFERLPMETAETRNLIMNALRRLVHERPSQIEAKLLPILGDENTEMRDIAVKMLRDMPNPTQTLRLFIQSSQGLVSWVQQRSIEAIRQVSDDLTASLIELLGDPETEVQVGAMAIAKGMTDRRLIAPLVAIVRSDHDWWIRSTAVDLLSSFSDDSVTAVLVQHLDDGDLKYSAVAALGAVGTPLSLEHLLSCLGNPCPATRRAALEALSKCATPQVDDALRYVALEDPDHSVSNKASAILELRNALDDTTRAEINANHTVTLDPSLIELEMVNDGLNGGP